MTSNGMSHVQMQIPEGLVESLVGAEIAKRIGTPEEFIDTVVRQTLTRPIRDPNDRYGKDAPMVQHAVNAMLDASVKKELEFWIQEHTDKIRTTIKKWIAANGDDFLEQIVEKFTGELAANIRVKVDVTIPEKEY